MAALAAGVLVVIGLPTGWALTRPPADVGSDGAEATAAATPQRLPLPTPVVTPTAGLLGSRSARATDVQPVPIVEPVRLRAPSIGVDAPVVPVGVVPETSEMELPPDIHTIGWYRPGVAPGEPAGTVVLAGHVDSRVAGAGVFVDLERLQPRDPVSVVLADGTELRYEVIGRRRYAKAELPTAELFSTSGSPRLALVTCGGEFDSADRSYVDNVVAYARPV
jgi:sortase family protein